MRITKNKFGNRTKSKRKFEIQNKSMKIYRISIESIKTKKIDEIAASCDGVSFFAAKLLTM